MTRWRDARVIGAAGTFALLVTWQLLSVTVLHAGGTVPGPVEIVRQLGRDGAGLYLVNAEVTVSAAVQGYLYGNLAAIVLGVVALVVPALGRPITHLGVFSYCLPIVAIGPVFAIVFPADLSRVLLAGHLDRLRDA